MIRDREVLDLLRDEPELLAIADAVAETESSPRRFRSYRAPAAVALAAAAIFGLVLSSPWDRDNGKGFVLDRALAAIESRGPVVHMTIRFEQTGRVPAVTTESFYDKRRGLVRVVSRSEGKVVSDYTTRASEDEFVTFPGLLDAADFYRKALKTGRAKVVGKGTWEGRPVYWVELEEGGGPGIFQIGIDRETYRPDVFRGLNPNRTPAGFQVAVLGFEYVSPVDAAFQTDAPVLVTGTVIGQDCRPMRARVGAFLAPSPTGPSRQISAEIASARSGRDGRFTLRVDPEKSPFREALLRKSGTFRFQLNAQGKDVAAGFGFEPFSRVVRNGRWEPSAPVTIWVSRGPPPLCD